MLIPLLIYVLSTDFDNPIDRDLMERLQSGEKEVVDKVHEAHYPWLMNYIFRKVGNENADDICQDVWLALLKVVGTSSAPNQTLRGWLVRVANSQIERYYRKNPKITRLEEEWMITSMDPENDPIQIEHLRKAIMISLSKDQREVILWRFFQSFNIAETAEAMGITEGAVKSLQFRAIKKLKDILEKENENE